MSLRDVGNERKNQPGTAGRNKIRDVILPALGDEDRAALLDWLADPEWSNHMIAESLHAFARAERKYNLSASHTVVQKYREQEGLVWD